MSNLISGFVNKDVDNIKPSSGVALPVRFVLPADTVIGILLLKHVFNIIAHSLIVLGLVKIEALAGKFDQSNL